MVLLAILLFVIAGVLGALVGMLIHVVGEQIARARRIASIRRQTRRLIRLYGDARP